ncbi:MAG TPA: Ig-like domain-containing protein [Geothrix sp.]|nr:Ig-like domain-containing protein [Geothrix sp.]
MGTRTTHLLTSLALLVASGLQAQENAYTAQLKHNYSRFTRGDDTKVIDEAWGRQQWFLERMGGKLGPDFTQRLLDQASRERAKYPGRFTSGSDLKLMPLAAGGTTWVNIGPTGSAFTQNGVELTKVDSGRPRVILPDTEDTTGNTVYMVAAGGGLWKTTDFLSSTPHWAALTDFVGSNISGSAAFGRTTQTLYLGSGDAFDLGVGGFMIKSTDGGAHWTSGTVLGTSSKILDVKVDPTQAQDIVLVGTDAGLFRSGDGGATYAPVASMSTVGTVWTLVHTSAGWLASAEDSAGNGSLFLSTDRGLTWSPITNAGTVYTGAGRTTLAVGQPGDAVVYAFAANTANAAQLDLFKSTNGGQTWVALGITTKVPTNPNSDQGTMNLMADQPWYNHMILVDPMDAARNTVYLGGQLASAKTTDGGTTWTLLSDWLPDPTSDTGSMPYIHADFHCAAFSNLGGHPRLYFGTDGGLFTSADGGATWDDTKNKGLVTHLIYALAANPGVAGSALIGVQDNGTRIRQGTTGTFNQIRGGDGFGVSWAQAVTDATAVSMSSYVYNTIKRATVSPVTDQLDWNSFTTGLGSTGSTDNGTSYYFVTPIVTPAATADPSGKVFFTYSNNGTGTNSKKIFRSSATGWTMIGKAGTTPGLSHSVRSVSHGLGVSPLDIQRIALAGLGGYVPVTVNGGSTWTETFLGAEPTTPGMVAGWQGYNSNVAWANNSLLYVCSEASTAGATRVAKSTNGGTTWTAADNGLPDVPVTKLAVDPGDATGNTVYAATWLGAYKTTNGGTTWALFGTGLPQGRVTDIWVAPDSSSVRVSTWGRGVWELQAAPVGPTVSVSPTAVTMVNGGTQNFLPTVTGGTTNTVTWTASSGIIGAGPTASGVVQGYTAPASGSSATVTATTVATPAATATAAVTLVSPAAVSVAVSPATVELMTGSATQAFSATVSPLTNQAVTWTGTGVSGSGVFNASGLAAGPYTVTATSAASPTSPAGTATVNLIAPSSVTVTVAPAPATALIGATKQFTATVSGLSTGNQGVTWSVSGGGTISGTGLFTATTAGSFTVTATNTFSGVTGSATVAVKSMDLDANGIVDLRDLLFFAQNYGTSNAACDLNGSGTVNDTDLDLLIAGL